MSTNWEKVYVFISSTFHDMHAERDFLVKRVFPQLQEWCEKRQLRLMDIDLRWGVTEEDATQHGSVVATCLSRIDDSRPFFLCFLGQRRGWVPPKENIPAGTLVQFPFLHEHAGQASITELEILHAAAETRQTGRREHGLPMKAFFFLRDPGYLEQLPANPPLLRKIYTNEAVTDPQRRRQHEQELLHWREEVLPTLGYPVRRYQAAWDSTARSPELAIPLQAPTRRLAEWQDTWRAVGVRAGSADLADSPEDYQKAVSFNQSLTTGRLAQFHVDGQPLEDVLLEDLKTAIAERFPHHGEEQTSNPLEKEISQQSLFLYLNSEGYIARGGAYAPLYDYLNTLAGEPLALVGPPGSGKTALLASWIEGINAQYQQRPRPVFYRFIGASDESCSAPALLFSLMQEMKARLSLKQSIPTNPDELRDAFLPMLAAAGQRAPLVLVLDALNQLESGLSDLAWLPWQLPEGVHLVISFKNDDETGRTLQDMIVENGLARIVTVPPFTLADRRALARTFLAQYLKDLDATELDILVNLEGAENPLFLKVLLGELRLHGAYTSLEQRIRSSFGTTPHAAFLAVLDRLEHDPAYSALPPAWLVPHLFALLAYSRRGLSDVELAGLITTAARETIMACHPLEALDAVRAVLRQVRPYLSRSEGRFGFFYESFKNAVLERYTTDSAAGYPTRRTTKSWHLLLSHYFASLSQPPAPEEQALPPVDPDQRTRRFVSEYPYHLCAGGHWLHLRQTLTNLKFVELKCRLGLTAELLDDYRMAIDRLQQQSSHGDAHRILSAVNRFVQDEAGNLSRFAAFPGFTAQQAYNHAMNSPFEGQANLLLSQSPDVHFMRLKHQRARYSEKPARLHLLPVSSCTTLALSADGRTLVTGSSDSPAGVPVDRSISIWQVPEGNLVKKLYGHTGKVLGVAITPNGDLAASIATDGAARVWELVSGKCIHTMKTASTLANCVAFNVPFNRLVIASANTIEAWSLKDGSLLNHWECPGRGYYPTRLRTAAGVVAAVCPSGVYVMDIETGGLRCAIHDLPGPASDAALSEDGRLAVVTVDAPAYNISGAGSAFIWDLAAGKCLHRLGEHRLGVRSATISPDGRCALTAGWDMQLSIWDTASGNKVKSVRDTLSTINEICLAGDGSMALTLNVTHKIRVWDLNGQETLQESAHQDDISAVCLSDDSQVAASGAGSLAEKDHSVFLWNAGQGGVLHRIGEHRKKILKVAISADHARIFSWGTDGSVKVWRAAQNVLPRHTLEHHELECLSPDGRFIYTYSKNGLSQCDGETGKTIRSLIGRAVMAVSGDGRRALAVNAEDSVELLDLQSLKVIKRLPLKPVSKKASAFALDHAGSAMLMIDDRPVLTWWDLSAGACTAEVPIQTKDSVDLFLSPDLPLAYWHERSNHTLWSWDMERNTTALRVHLPEDVFALFMLGRRGAYFISSHFDQCLRLWSTAGGNCTAVYPVGEPIKDIACRGNRVICGDESGNVHLLALNHLPLDPPPLEVVRLWRYGAGDDPGKWDDDLTSRCPWCGKRFVLEVEYREQNFLERAAKLPLEVSKVNAPGNCPHCRRPLRFSTQAYDSRSLYPR